MKTSVVNIHHKVPYDKYIGRGSKYGNLFSHMKGTKALYQVETRDEAVDFFWLWLLEQHELIEDAYRELKGRTLGCFCKPKRCHGDIYVMLIEFIDENLHEIQVYMKENRVRFGKAASDVYKKTCRHPATQTGLAFGNPVRQVINRAPARIGDEVRKCPF